MSEAVKVGVEIEIKELYKSFDHKEVLKNINLTVKRGQFVAIVGKSGSGKSTLLRLTAGLEKAESGTLLFNEQEIKQSQANVTMMYQDSRLLPWKKVMDNVVLGLKSNKKQDANKALDAVGLTEFANVWPATLSGGQKQRVALARALIRHPDLMMLDEPLSALDALTRNEMQDLIEQIWMENEFTALLVTHDVREAVKLADRIILLEDGTITLDIENHAERPRTTTDPQIIDIEEQILSRIMEEEKNT
ncbi:ATP-binding cassette domain-containing protein [Alkalicoccobacillus porphyridii]|uniref:ATP-binding cassette domain-containing protein n=1 Tax=Alkalicoccobacillus porphyridii TaxID=2597270 RepID=A0A553ZTG4_9BACI|nr:ATP-binding cassette domain-containing protein [Alkalicoccobacillus porphyridii]TSB44768.1 ATP-binding cassette domain-containing protein [Alkalicoccobacillus porphyridii]